MSSDMLTEFIHRVKDGEMKAVDVPVLAASIFAAITGVIVEIACPFWGILIAISAMCDHSAEKLWMLIPCVLIFSIMTSLIYFVSKKLEDEWY